MGVIFDIYLKPVYVLIEIKRLMIGWISAHKVAHKCSLPRACPGASNLIFQP
jgi:hypothetical protein